MGTENAVMAAVLAEGATVLMNAACEPHVQDLCRFLVSLGAQIEGIGSNVLRIEGVERALGRRAPDRRPSTSRRRASSASPRSPAATLTIDGIEPDDFVSILPAFERLGDRGRARRDERPRPARAGARDPRRPRRPDPEDRGRPLAGVPGRPHLDRARGRDPGARHDPDLREDVREPAVLRRQARARWARGSSSATRTAPSSAARRKLHGERLESPDIRAGMAMLIAALCAEGTSVIGNIGQIDRGYERIDERLRALGASIERV